MALAVGSESRKQHGNLSLLRPICLRLAEGVSRVEMFECRQHSNVTLIDGIGHLRTEREWTTICEMFIDHIATDA